MTTLIATAALAAVLVFQPAPGEADSRFEFYFGIDPYYEPWPYLYDRRHYDDRVTCRQARRILSGYYGYHDIATVDCQGDSFKFNAWRNGRKYRIKLNAWTGQVTSVKRLR